MRRWAFLAGALILPQICAHHARAEAVEMTAPSSTSEASEGALDKAIDEFGTLASWVDFPEPYAQSVISTASAMLAGREGVNGHFVVIVDRSVHRQAIFVTLVSEDGQDWKVVYQGAGSTGKPGGKEHVKAPVGIFDLDGSMRAERAEGTCNETPIGGNGLRGSRVWDFGWQATDDWRTAGAKMKIRMEMHATDPANLEHRIGRADSEGCIRIHADLNAAMDRYGVLDAAAGEMAVSGDARWKQVLGPGHVFMPESGRYLVILDSDSDSV